MPPMFDKPGRTLPVLGSEIVDSRHGLYVEVIYVEVLCEVFLLGGNVLVGWLLVSYTNRVF